MITCGVDEAGRGPVIGPLVMAGVSIDESKLDVLKNLGVKDSKQVLKPERESLFEEIKKVAKDYKIIIVHPKEIDDSLNSDNSNLNLLEQDKTCEIIKMLKPDKAIVDSPSTNTEIYQKQIADKTNIEIVAEHKADEKYVECSAASILAKVTRDREIENIKERIKKDVGSGYPADPITQEFIKENWEEHPDIFRKTWATYKKLVDKNKQKTL